MVPLFVIDYITGGFGGAFVLIYGSEFATMPPVSEQMLNRYIDSYFTAMRPDNWDHSNIFFKN